MKSKLMSLVQILGPRSATTAANPNSWAFGSLWRRMFADQQEEEQEQEEQAVLCDEHHDVARVTSETARSHPLASTRINRHEVLSEFIRNGHRVNLGRDLLSSTGIAMNNHVYQNPFHNNSNNNTVSPMAQVREQQQLYTPNLSIPDDDDNYLTRAQ